ncbi:MAG: hypothetical protein AB7G80_08695 [Dongiaceae bacterium]
MEWILGGIVGLLGLLYGWDIYLRRSNRAEDAKLHDYSHDVD